MNQRDEIKSVLQCVVIAELLISAVALVNRIHQHADREGCFSGTLRGVSLLECAVRGSVVNDEDLNFVGISQGGRDPLNDTPNGLFGVVGDDKNQETGLFWGGHFGTRIFTYRSAGLYNGNSPALTRFPRADDWFFMGSAQTNVPRWLYPLLAAAVVYGYWVPRLSSGFWVDEAGSYWITHQGFTHVWERLQIYPGQSIIYMHLSLLFATTGPHKEFIMRIPSVLATLLAARLLYILAERIVGEGSGYLAVIPFLSAGAIVETATNARPYALGIAVVLASFLSLREWVHTGTTRQYLIYGFTSSLVVYFHYLFGLIFLAQALYLFAAYRAGRRIQWARVVMVAVFIAGAAVPLAWQILTIARQAGSWTTLSPPGVVSFITFYPTQTISVAVVALLLYRFLYPKWFARRSGLAWDDGVLLGLWMLLGPVIIFATARVTGYALFTQRYLIYGLLPTFVFIAWALRQINNERARFAVLSALSLNAFLYVFTLGEPDWRTPLQAVQQVVSPDTPLLIQSGFTESANRDLRGEPKETSYLFAPLAPYPLQHKMIPVPYALTPISRQAVEQQVEQQALHCRKFSLLAIDGTNVEVELTNWFTEKGYRPTKYHISGFTLITYEKPV